MVKQTLAIVVLSSSVCFGGGSFWYVGAGTEEGVPMVLASSSQRSVAVALRRRADFAVMPLRVVSRDRDPEQRATDVRDTLKEIAQKAKRNPELEFDPGPVRLSSREGKVLASLSSWASPSSGAQARILVRLADGDRNLFACAELVKDFLAEFETPRRTELHPSSISLAVKDPERFRAQLLDAIGEELAALRKRFAGATSFHLSGLEGPVLVRQADERHVELFINYRLSLELEQRSAE